jgi:hypothetical protein
LLALALKLDRRLSRAARYPAAPWPTLRLPRVWAGFHQNQVRNLLGEGPEFEETCRQCRLSAAVLFQRTARRVFGLVLFPMDWVTSQLEQAATIFAELRPSLRRQTCRIAGVPDGLIGYQGASAFDFYNSRYRNARRGVTTPSHREKYKPLIPRTGLAEARPVQTSNCVA